MEKKPTQIEVKGTSRKQKIDVDVRLSEREIMECIIDVLSSYPKDVRKNIFKIADFKHRAEKLKEML